MKAVKQSIARGVAIEQAIRAALLGNGLTLLDFAAKYDLPYTETTKAVKGTARASAAQVDALVTELGGSAKEWRELLWLAGKPDDVDAPKPAKVASQ